MTAAVEALLAKVIVRLRPACVLLPSEATPDRDLDNRLRALTADRDITLLVEDDVERALTIGADGVHIPPDASRYRQARTRLGERATIGFGCIENRHDAMVLAELGADYIGFGDPSGRGEADLHSQAELISWWSDIFVIPSVAFDVETAEAAARLAALGADFIAPSPNLWQGPDAEARITDLVSQMRTARRPA
jgi:thiamine-phosphate pyrophosphorylase